MSGSLTFVPSAAAAASAPPRRARPAARGPLPRILLCAAWIAGPGNWPLWRALHGLPELHGAAALGFALALGTAIAALLTALLAALAWRRTLKPAIALLLVSAALGAHFTGSYGVVIDPTMMTNVLQTDAREVRDLLGPGLLLSLIALAAVPMAGLLRGRVDYGRLPVRALRNVLAVALALALLALLVLASFRTLSVEMRNHKPLRYLVNPLAAYYSLGRVAFAGSAGESGPARAIGLQARAAPLGAGARPPLLMIVIGETARADHFALNGYPRPTTPRLAALGVLSFREVSSCGTNTAASLPCMLSPLGRETYGRSDGHSENLLDLLQRAGLAVLWIENQAGCKAQCLRVPHVQAHEPAGSAGTPPEALCPGGECYDEALLHGLDARLAALDPARRARGVVLVLHQMGSHGPAYWRRSPPDAKPFGPECASSALQDCPPEALIDAYDNTIAYTDRVLARAIGWLSGQAGYDPALLYVSDHGESLGENRLYLHGLPYGLAPRAQKHVPLIYWQPAAGAGQPERIDAGCLRQRLDAPLSHDHLFHTVLGLLGVQAEEYRAALDAFAPCARP